MNKQEFIHRFMADQRKRKIVEQKAKENVINDYYRCRKNVKGKPFGYSGVMM